MNLQEKRALITGGSSGIGFAIAEAMLAKGTQIVITGRRPDVLSTAAKRLRVGGGRVDFVAADVSTEKGRETTLKFALDKLGGLDVLVNNAGGVRAGRLEDTTEAEIRTMIEVDLVAPILLTRAALPKLRASTDGSRCQHHVGYRTRCGAVLRNLRRGQGWAGEVRRIAPPRTERRGRASHDSLSGGDGYAHDELVTCRA